jgi:hypothetical protein
MLEELRRIFRAQSPSFADVPVRERPPHEEHGHRLDEAVECFKEHFPEDWALISRCPTVHGLEVMVGKLKA